MADGDGTVGYDADVKPLFRDRDREAMRHVAEFDLWSYEDVRARAAAILDRLERGNMPCDGAWPKDRVQLFKRWVDSGMQP